MEVLVQQTRMKTRILSDPVICFRAGLGRLDVLEAPALTRLSPSHPRAHPKSRFIELAVPLVCDSNIPLPPQMYVYSFVAPPEAARVHFRRSARRHEQDPVLPLPVR